MTFTNALRRRLSRGYNDYFRAVLRVVRLWLWLRHRLWRPLLGRLTGDRLKGRWAAQDQRERDRMIRAIQRMAPEERWENLRRTVHGLGFDDNVAFDQWVKFEREFASPGRISESSA